MTIDPDAGDPADVDDDADSGDRMLALLLESTDPAVAELGMHVLEGLGFTVEVATPSGSGPSLVFDYEAARYAIVSVGAGASAGEGSGTEAGQVDLGPPSTRYQLLAALFIGATGLKDAEGLIRIEPDADGAWTDHLVETIRLLGWLS